MRKRSAGKPNTLPSVSSKWMSRFSDQALMATTSVSVIMVSLVQWSFVFKDQPLNFP
jgi:hypothetical protein